MISKLPTKFEMTKDRGIKYFYNDKYITNGKFLIKRDILKNDYAYCEPTEINMPDLDGILNHDKNSLVMFMKTDIIVEKVENSFSKRREEKTYMRVYRNHEGEIAFINEEFIKAFSLNDLYSKGFDQPFEDYSGDIVVMPMKCEYTKISLS